MPAGPIGSCWGTGSWADTAWEANAWSDGLVSRLPDNIIVATVSVDDVDRTVTVDAPVRTVTFDG